MPQTLTEHLHKPQAFRGLARLSCCGLHQKYHKTLLQPAVLFYTA